ncbi:MAG: hypothetical protein HY677_05315 [Chloroflexi bacterium]|nr:hypothetical protein [Chloroflexota bacterium]
MSEIKSAFERAMERVEKLGQPTEEERGRWKYGPEGQKLAAGYLRGQANLKAALASADEKARPYLKEAMAEVLLANLSLPDNEAAKNRSNLAIDGLREIAGDKRKVDGIMAQLRNIFQHYETQGAQQRQQAYQQVKENFGRMVRQAAQRQYGNAPVPDVDVEGHPQFQQEWHRVLGQINSQYEKVLEEYKEQLAAAV